MQDWNEQMLTDHDVAQLLRASTKTVYRLVEEDADFPKPVKVGKRDRWTLGEIRDWQQLQRLKAKMVRPNLDKPGQTGTNEVPADLGSSEKKPRR